MHNFYKVPIGFLFYIWFIALFIPFTIVWASICILVSNFWPPKYGHKLRFFPIFWGWVGVRLIFSPVRVYHAEKAKNIPCIIISNHQSLFDILAALGFYPLDFLFLSKEEVFKIPFVGGAMRKVGYIPINRSSPKKAARSLEIVETEIRKNNRVLIYPEGTRSKDAKVMLPFKAGAFQVAEKGPFPILPIVLYGTQETRPMHSNVLFFPHRIAIQVLDPIMPDHELHPANKQSKLSEKDKLTGIRAMLEKVYLQLAANKGKMPAQV